MTPYGKREMGIAIISIIDIFHEYSLNVTADANNVSIYIFSIEVYYYLCDQCNQPNKV